VEGAVGAAVGTERGRGLRATERPRVRGPFERSGVRRSTLPMRGVGTVVGPGRRVEEAASGAFRARRLLLDVIGVDDRCVLAGIDRVGGSAAAGGLPHRSGARGTGVPQVLTARGMFIGTGAPRLTLGQATHLGGAGNVVVLLPGVSRFGSRRTGRKSRLCFGVGVGDARGQRAPAVRSTDRVLA